MRNPLGAPLTASGNPAGSGRGAAVGIWLSGGLIVLAVLTAYQGAYSVPFVFDDLPAIFGNSSLRHWGTVLSPPSNGATVTGRPVLNLSLALNHALGGEAVWGYHAVNLAIHILAGLTLFGIVRRTLLRWSALSPTRLSADSVAQRVGDNALHPTFVAFAIALIWAVHPLQTESVTYVVQRAESLMGLFYLLTLYCFIRYAEGRPDFAKTAADQAPGGALWAGLSVICCLLGMATKEVMVSAPVMALLYDRTFVSGSFREAWRRHGRLFLGLAVTWVPLVWLVLGSKSRGGTAGFGLGISWWPYALTQFPATLRYLQLSFWPHPLVFDYGTQWVQNPWSVLPSAVAVVALVVGTVAAFLRPAPKPGSQGWRALGFAGAWFFAILAPTSLIPGTRQTMAEHRMYLALAPVAVLAVIGLDRAIRRVGTPRGARLSFIVIAGLIALGFGGLTARRNEDYRTDLVLWSDTAAKVPENPYAHNNVGIALFQAGRLAEATAQYREALRWKSDYPNAYNNWGNVMLREGHYEDAAAEFARAVQFDNGYSDAINNWGTALAKLGRLDEAKAKFEEALRDTPENSKYHANYGKILLQTGGLPAALAEYEKALELNSEDAESHFGYANALASGGRIPEAMKEYTEALRCRPDYAEAHNNLGNMLAASGRLSEALAQFEEGVRLEPANAGFHGNLGKALAESGRLDDAIAQFETALRLDPAIPRVRENLLQLQAARADVR